MAFTGTGKARREPCAKCGLPVFIAERLNVGKHLYHRTCFRCARCTSQLTLANYYETENGDFCCEICPDEEKVAAAKASPEKSVLLRSMSDEEKTASLKTFSNEPDNYSTMFESALESIRDDNSSEFFKARSRFIQSQVEESSDSAPEDEPPDLPKTAPPKLDASEDVELKDALVKSSDSGFPSNRLVETIAKADDVSVSDRSNNASFELEETRNIVTKDKPAAEGGDTSLVRARMRLFESNSHEVDFRKSDSNKNSQNTFRVLSRSPKSPTSNKDDVTKPAIPLVKLEDLENFEQLGKKEFHDDVTANIDDNRHISEVAITLTHKDDAKHSYSNISNRYLKTLEDDDIKDTSPSDKEEKGEDEKIETTPTSVEEKDPRDIKEEPMETDTSLVLNETKNDVVIDSFTTTPPTQDETSPLTPSPDSSDQPTEASTNQTPEPEYESVEKEKRDDTKLETPPDEEEKYPGDLNPFGDDDEDSSSDQKKANVSLNPFEDDEDEEEEDSKAVSKPVPSPRFKKKVLPTDADKEIKGTPEHLSSVRIQRISVNPFESDEDETGRPPVPATRKKKVITAPKISLNPFESEDDENEEEDTIKQPVPKPRTSVGR